MKALRYFVALAATSLMVSGSASADPFGGLLGTLFHPPGGGPDHHDSPAPLLGAGIPGFALVGAVYAVSAVARRIKNRSKR